MSYIPQLIGALIILIVGYIVAKLLQAVVTRLLGAIGFEGWTCWAGVALAAAIAFGFGAQNVARDIVERAYERRRAKVMGEPAEREFSTQGDSVPRTRPPLHRDAEE
jgi:hypothetical protein